MVPTPNLPQKMIELRAYARWEEGGRRVLPPEEQRREFLMSAVTPFSTCPQSMAVKWLTTVYDASPVWQVSKIFPP